MSWIEAQQRGRDLVELILRSVEQAVIVLEIPSTKEVWMAGSNAGRDGYEALKSISHFLILVLRPLILALGWTSFLVARFIWEHLIVEGIYNHGLSQAREAMIAFWRFQRSLSVEQLLLEAAVLAALVALSFLRRWLNKNQYIQRARNAINQQTRRASQTYRATVNRIATVSLGLAAMTPHAAYMLSAAGLSFLMPGLVSVFAHRGVISLLSWWYPVLCTITLLHEYSQEEKIKSDDSVNAKIDKENEPVHSPKDILQENETPRRKLSQTKREPLTEQRKKQRSPSVISRTTETVRKRKKRQSTAAIISVVSSNENNLSEELDYWLRFWMVRSAVVTLKALFGYFTPKAFVVVLQNLEFFFYVWIYFMPFIVPQTIGGQKLPEARPLQVIVSHLSPVAEKLHETVAGIVPEQFWRSTVVATSTRFADLTVLVGLLSRGTADWLLHVLEESRSLLLPSVTMLMPGIITQYGALYVQYVPMIARSTKNDTSHVQLKYWVLNAIVGALLQNSAGVLWWIPFSSHATFLLWCYLCLPHSIETWYSAMNQELCDFGLLPGSEQSTDLSETRVGRLSKILLESLPRAEDVGDGASDAKTGDNKLSNEGSAGDDVGANNDAKSPGKDGVSLVNEKEQAEKREANILPLETKTETRQHVRRSLRTRRQRS